MSECYGASSALFLANLLDLDFFARALRFCYAEAFSMQLNAKRAPKQMQAIAVFCLFRVQSRLSAIQPNKTRSKRLTRPTRVTFK